MILKTVTFQSKTVRTNRYTTNQEIVPMYMA